MSAFLSDGDITLRPIERTDLEQLRTWRNDPELRSRTREWKALNLENQTRWFERMSDPQRTDHMFILEHETQAIGVIGLCGWNHHDRHAEISFYIGDAEHRGKGYMKRALSLLIGWGFQQGLHRIWAEVYDFNVASVKLLEKLGFTYEGRQRQHVFRDGRFVDSVMMGLLSIDTSKPLGDGHRDVWAEWLQAQNFDTERHARRKAKTLARVRLFRARKRQQRLAMKETP
jgi:RimJ/RimL family protein N-acetyltransferase